MRLNQNVFKIKRPIGNEIGRVNTNYIENQGDIDKGREHDVEFVEP